MDWIQVHCAAALREDFLHVHTVPLAEFPYWHASIGKNTSHRLAIEDGAVVLVNCDADNLLGTNFPVEVLTRMKLETDGNCRMVFQWYSGSRNDGTFGRIAYTTEDFQDIGGNRKKGPRI